MESRLSRIVYPMVAMRSLITRLLVLAICVTGFQFVTPVLAPGLVPGFSEVAEAQEQPRRRRGWNPLSPLMRLFDGPQQTRKRFRRNQRTRRPTRLAPVQRAAPEVVRLRKNSDARRVLVVGDFMAKGLEDALDVAFAQAPDIAIFEETDSASGLAAATGRNWAETIGPALDKRQADMVVVMIGANDFVGVRSETGVIQPDNDAWERAYGLRVLSFLNEMARREIPVFWVGLVPTEEGARSAHASKMSAIYRENVSLAGGVFVDIWDSFADGDGQYTARGPDVNGQTKSLRTKDGIGFSKAGFRKVAFFVEQELRSRLSSGRRLAAIQAITDEPEVVEIGSIIPLYDSRIGLKVDLLGAEAKPAVPEDQTAQHKLVVAGEALPRQPGRIDDFRWTAATN